MGTLLYTAILSLYRVRHRLKPTKCLRDLDDEASGSERRARRPGWRQEGRAAVQTRSGEEDLGLPQGPQAPGPREQAVLQARRQDEANLRGGEGPRLRHGQVPQDPPDQPLD